MRCNPLLVLLGAIAVSACTNDTPTALQHGARPSFLISDAAHEGGTPGFFFLPPMVSQPTFGGTFDADIATLNPQIAICDVTGGLDTNCGGTGGTPAVLVFTTTSTPAITVDPTTPQYQVNWDTRSAGFAAGHTYRAHVTAGAAGTRRELGFAGALLTGTPGQAKQSAAGDIVVLQYGRTLPIHFRVETGIPGMLSVSAASPTVATGGTDVITATVRDLHGAALAGATVAWSSTSAPATNVVADLVPSSGSTAGDGTVPATLTAGASPGSAAITATAAGVSGTAMVTVTPAGFTLAALSVSDLHACGLTAAGKAYCWGANDFGQLGIGSFGGYSALPLPVTGGLTFKQIAGSSITTCALDLQGAAYCWGNGGNGGVGDGTTITRPAPTAVQTSLRFLQITEHGGSHCALSTDYTAWCWGLGYGSTVLAIPGGLTFRAIFGGGADDCGITFDSAAYCWGGDYGGSTPYRIPGRHSFSSLTIGEHHVCGLDLDGAAWCWLANLDGEFGNGTLYPDWDSRNSTPELAALGMHFASLRAGEFNTCGLTSDGVAYCWGDNSRGQIGDGTTTQRLSPAAVATTLRFSALLTGQWYSSCGLTAEGAVYCWGNNSFGQLGDGTLVNRLTPVPVM